MKWHQLMNIKYYHILIHEIKDDIMIDINKKKITKESQIHLMAHWTPHSFDTPIFVNNKHQNNDSKSNDNSKPTNI